MIAYSSRSDNSRPWLDFVKWEDKKKKILPEKSAYKVRLCYEKKKGHYSTYAHQRGGGEVNGTFCLLILMELNSC